MPDQLREVLRTALNGLQALADKYDEIAAVTASLKGCQASLANVRSDHDRTLAELNEAQRQLMATEAAHKKMLAEMEDISRSVQAKYCDLARKYDEKQVAIDAQRAEHDQILASMHSLKLQLDRELEGVRQ